MIHISHTYRPQVLLLGNGLNLSYGGTSWSELMGKISVRKDLTAELSCPMPLQAILVTNDHVYTAMKENTDLFRGTVSEMLREKLQMLLRAGFDDILTTNYSYELEAAAAPKGVASDYFLKKTCCNISGSGKAEGKYLLHTCQCIPFENENNRVWHIHGEARKPSSMILGHYYYGSSLYRMEQFFSGKGNSYQERQKNKEDQTITGWLDSFLLGDVYILGLSMDYSEVDLWWLLNRKKKENADTGNVYFYHQGGEGIDEKEELLKLLGVHIEHCGFGKAKGTKEEKDAQYAAFYEKAITDICTRVHAIQMQQRGENDGNH